MNNPQSTRSAGGTIEIQASPERVWKALTDAADLVRWFPLEARVTPGVGGSIYMSWQNEFAAESRIIAWEPYRLLAISWGWSDEASNPPQVTEYRLDDQRGITILRAVTSGFPLDSSWDDHVEGTNRGWKFELKSLQEYLEHHDGQAREIVYLRHRVPKPIAAEWPRLLSPEALGEPPLGGQPFDIAFPYQYAVVIPNLGGGLLRISYEPCMADPESRDITIWLQAWGEERAALQQYRDTWRQLLARLFPEGVTQ